jgi:homoserine O-acetyltransferase
VKPEPGLEARRPQANLTPTYEGDFVLDEPLLLECGRALAGVTLHYAVYGRLNAARTTPCWSAMRSGSALVGSWWPEIFAPGAVLSLDHDFVICINMLGSCYGSTGPRLGEPGDGQQVYGPDFPLVSIRDNVRAQAKLLDSLGIRRLRLVLGGSIGGMQALDWAIHDPSAWSAR